MKNKSTIIAAVVALGLIGGIAAFAMNGDDKEETTQTSQTTPSTSSTEKKMETPKPTQTVVDLAVATPTLSTLVTAVTSADLATTLSGTGPFTVFAPTNDAFAKLPAGTVETLLKPENKAKLQSILTYHVVSGKVMSSDLKNGQVVKTVQGKDLTVMIENGKVSLKDTLGNMSTVSKADIDASNGVVHVIDSVVMPE